MKVVYIYAIEVNGILSSLAFSNYKNARDYMVKKARHMNTFKGEKPQFTDYSAEYFYVPKNDVNDPYKSGFIKIRVLDVHDMEEKR